MLDKQELTKRAAAIRMIALDVDGVMTDCRDYYNAEGAVSKAFSIRDGFGIVMARRAGIEFAIITGQKSAVVEQRAARLDITEVHQGFVDKSDVMRGILTRHNLKPSQVTFMGDDLFDLPVLRMVGLATAPDDAHEDVKAEAHWVSKYPGGKGAVRELTELIIKARGLWEKTLSEFVKA